MPESRSEAHAVPLPHSSGSRGQVIGWVASALRRKAFQNIRSTQSHWVFYMHGPIAHSAPFHACGGSVAYDGFFWALSFSKMVAGRLWSQKPCKCKPSLLAREFAAHWVFHEDFVILGALLWTHISHFIGGRAALHRLPCLPSPLAYRARVARPHVCLVRQTALRTTPPLDALS